MENDLGEKETLVLSGESRPIKQLGTCVEKVAEVESRTQQKEKGPLFPGKEGKWGVWA